MNEKIISEIKNYAYSNNVPIMTDEGIDYLLKYIKDNNVKNILEIGTAIGYSSIMMCGVDSGVRVTTIERDEARYMEAVKNIGNVGFEDKIKLIYGDALEVSFDEEYDLIFIDAAKAQNINFFEKFEKNLKVGGTIITDNMKFHGLVDKKDSEISSRNLRQLVRKVRKYTEFLKENKAYQTEFFEFGDGIAVSIKK